MAPCEEYFSCLICHEVPEPSQAVQCRGCRTVFCQDCVTKWSESSKLCANCRQKHKYEPADKAIQRVIGETQVECPYECGKTTTKSELRDHCRLCPKRDGRFDFTARPDAKTASGAPGASTSTRQNENQNRAQDQEEECESSFSRGQMFAAAVGGALVGIIGGLVGAYVVNKSGIKKDK